MANTIDIGLVCVGGDIKLPIVVTNGDTAVTDLYVTIDVPDTVVYKSQNLPRGTYDSVAKTWTIGIMAADETLIGELTFTVLDDSNPKFKFDMEVISSSGCDVCGEITECVVLEGLSCTELRKCDPDIAITNEFIFGKGSSNNAVDVSTNDNACPASLVRTYEWADVDSINGTLTGDPDNALYTPEANFCGIDFATYNVLCNGVIVDTAEVRFNVTCAAIDDNAFPIDVDAVSIVDTSRNDLVCLFGATTTWHLISDDAADGAGLSEPTSEGDVTISDWDQSTGIASIAATNGFTGTATFDYRIRCKDLSGTLVYTTALVTVTLTVS